MGQHINQIVLFVRITNVYPGEERVHDRVVTVDAPTPADLADTDLLDEWATEHLLPLTGEGADYSNVDAGCFVEVITAPTGYDVLDGYECSSEG